jgi:hypothetical protein
MLRLRMLVLLALVFAIGLAAAPAGAASTTYHTGFTRWRGADDGGFAGWTHSGTQLASGTLSLEQSDLQSGSDAPGAYKGKNFYNGGSYFVGEATSPVVTTTSGDTGSPSRKRSPRGMLLHQPTLGSKPRSARTSLAPKQAITGPSGIAWASGPPITRPSSATP